MAIAVGAFLIVHGLIHVMWFVPPPDDPRYPFTWKSPRAEENLGWEPDRVRSLGKALVVAATVGFVLAGVGALGVTGLAGSWHALAAASAFISLAAISLFWHRYFIVGLALDIAIVVAGSLGWPAL